MLDSSARRAYVPGRYGQVHYYQGGQPGAATPLVCLHMSPYSGMVYENFVATMGAQRLTLAVDTPGFGNSAAPSAEPEIAGYAAAVGDVLDALDISEVHIMGYHTGSSIACELARQRPAQVQRLVLVSAPIWTVAERERVAHRVQPQVLSEDGSHLRAYWQEAVHYSMPGRTLEMLGGTFPERLLNPAIIHWGHLAASRYSLADGLGEIDKPVLVLNPDDDLHEQTARAGAYLKNPASRIEPLPGWGHGFLDVKTTEAAALVDQFLTP
jgi:pimeloyl-ACP methyl ester carboxylesterase